MISPEEYIQLKAFARQDGFFIGLLWIFTFACFIGSMTEPGLQIGFIAGITITPVIIYYRLKHYRDKVIGGTISFRRAFAFLAFVIVDASIILAAATFVYFYFMDKGQFMSKLQESLALPEIQQSLTQAGMDIKNINQQVQVFSQTRPIDIAFSMFFNTMISGLFLALVLSAIGKRTKVA
jgi:hypothetical protein